MHPTILLTGATGYIGGRLLRRLEAAGRPLRCLARNPHGLAGRAATTEVAHGDCLDRASLVRACTGIHTAYYLVHSMGAGTDFAELDRRAARNFGEAARLAGVRHIIYLGGLSDERADTAQARVGRALVEGLRSSTIVRSTAARAAIPFAPTPLRGAIAAAIADGLEGRLKTDRRTAIVHVPPDVAFAPVRQIGGANGWYFGNVLWRARGWIDQMIGGVGMRRGRRDPDTCTVGEPIDGWTVEAFEPNRRLRLSADMRLPGRGWLEFDVTPLDGGTSSRIQQTATFDPRGLLGRAYWYSILPLHELIFRGMLLSIARRAERAAARERLATS